MFNLLNKFIFEHPVEDVSYDEGDDTPKTAAQKRKLKKQNEQLKADIEAGVATPEETVASTQPKPVKAKKSQSKQKPPKPEKRKFQPHKVNSSQEQDARGKCKGSEIFTATTNFVKMMMGLKESTEKETSKTVKKRGRPLLYHPDVISLCSYLKSLLGISYLGLEGFLDGAIKAQNLDPRDDTKAPDHSTICRRIKKLIPSFSPNPNIISMPKRFKTFNKSFKKTYAIDSTGIKLFGQGEWLVRQHGYSKRRQWYKVHVVIDVDTMQIEGFIATGCGVHDSKVFATALPEDLTDCLVLADGAYHNRELHQLVYQRGGTLVASAPVNAVSWNYQQTVAFPAYELRDLLLTRRYRLAEAEFKLQSGYSHRCLVETTMSRIKAHIAKAFSRSLHGFSIEMANILTLLNKINEAGLKVLAVKPAVYA